MKKMLLVLTLFCAMSIAQAGMVTNNYVPSKFEKTFELRVYPAQKPIEEGACETVPLGTSLFIDSMKYKVVNIVAIINGKEHFWGAYYAQDDLELNKQGGLMLHINKE